MATLYVHPSCDGGVSCEFLGGSDENTICIHAREGEIKASYFLTVPMATQLVADLDELLGSRPRWDLDAEIEHRDEQIADLIAEAAKFPRDQIIDRARAMLMKVRLGTAMHGTIVEILELLNDPPEAVPESHAADTVEHYWRCDGCPTPCRLSSTRLVFKGTTRVGDLILCPFSLSGCKWVPEASFGIPEAVPESHAGKVVEHYWRCDGCTTPCRLITTRFAHEGTTKVGDLILCPLSLSDCKWVPDARFGTPGEVTESHAADTEREDEQALDDAIRELDDAIRERSETDGMPAIVASAVKLATIIFPTRPHNATLFADGLVSFFETAMEGRDNG